MNPKSECCEKCRSYDPFHQVEYCKFHNQVAICKCHQPKQEAGEDWRDNLHELIRKNLHAPGYLYIPIPQCIVDAIDAAYIAGLDDKDKALKEQAGEIREALPGSRDEQSGYDKEAIAFNTAVSKMLRILSKYL
jgi:hypothetical protein